MNRRDEPMHAIESKEAFHEVIHGWIVKPGWSDASHGCDGSRWFVALVARDFARIVPWIFPGRRPVFISARVHPGETPASYMLEGLGSRMELKRLLIVQSLDINT